MAESLAAPKAQMPRQIPFIIGNEAAERFSFYGMRNVLTDFLSGYLLVSLVAAERGPAAKEVFHTFAMGVYFFPMLGGFLSDRLLGKYRTILWLSLVYCIGQITLALSIDNTFGFYGGLLLIALGSGGIKPCVSAFVGDQFDQSNKHLAKVVFDAFYFIINFGSFFASLLIPPLLKSGYARLTFAVPAILMAVSVVIFFAGRGRYVQVPPALTSRERPRELARILEVMLEAFAALVAPVAAHLGYLHGGFAIALELVVFALLIARRVRGPVTPLATASDADSFLNVCSTALFGGGWNAGTVLVVLGAVLTRLTFTLWHTLHAVPTICLALVVFLLFAGVGTYLSVERARGRHSDEAVDGVKSVLRVLVLFALVTPFFSLFDQKATTWVLQGNAMQLPGWAWFKTASQMQAANPLLVMLLIPLNNLFMFPALRRMGIDPTPLRRMGVGLAFAASSFVAVAVMQQLMDRGQQLSVLWQLLPYTLLTLGEVLVSATGLEFAYSQAPARLKGVLMAFWSLATTIGNLWVLLANASVKSEGVTAAIKAQGWGVISTQMYFFAIFAFVAAAAFGLYARSYTVVDHYRK
ncbi:MAG: MFS transporter [Archangium sp.]